MDLEQELKEKIKQARQQAAQEPEVEQPVVEQEPIQQEPVVEGQQVEDNLEEDLVEEPEGDPEGELEVEPETEEYKKLDSSGKKFAHMRKEAKEKDNLIRELGERVARMEGAQSAKPEPVAEVKEDVIPDKEYEPEAWMDYQLKKRDEQIEKLSGKIETNNEQSAQQKAELVYKDLESSFASNDSTYMEAKKFLVTNRSKELKGLYPTATQSQIDAQVKAEEYKLVETMSNGGLTSDVIFKTFKTMAVDSGYKEVTTAKVDKTKLKKNIRKSASLNDAPGSGEDIGFSESQMSRMKSADFHRLAGNPKEMKKAMQALKAARIKASA